MMEEDTEEGEEEARAQRWNGQVPFSDQQPSA